jgi:uncharacterized phage infection (PIP) family protein YhgE
MHSEDPTQDHFYYKYLKYKQKYTELSEGGGLLKGLKKLGKSNLGKAIVELNADVDAVKTSDKKLTKRIAKVDKLHAALVNDSKFNLDKIDKFVQSFAKLLRDYANSKKLHDAKRKKTENDEAQCDNARKKDQKTADKAKTDAKSDKLETKYDDQQEKCDKVRDKLYNALDGLKETVGIAKEKLIEFMNSVVV